MLTFTKETRMNLQKVINRGFEFKQQPTSSDFEVNIY